MADRGAEAAQCSLGGYEAYLSAEDSLAAWIDEACARSPRAWDRQRRYSGRGAIGQTPQANIPAASNAFPRPSNPGASLASARGAVAAILSRALTDCVVSGARTVAERSMSVGSVPDVPHPADIPLCARACVSV
jgi:hypothetical protein